MIAQTLRDSHIEPISSDLDYVSRFTARLQEWHKWHQPDTFDDLLNFVTLSTFTKTASRWKAFVNSRHGESLSENTATTSI